MSEVKIRVLGREDLSWANERYAEIKFKESTEKDVLVKASIGGRVAGLGRLVPVDENNAELGGIYVFPEFRGKKIAEEIVRALIEMNTFPVLWCIPFEPLENFYRKFGFTHITNEIVPEEISDKVTWCEGRYPDKAILLVRS
ncbi:MAG: GNAT family N-acetyltransferase [Bacteriovoracaceae bacterium]